MDILRAIKRPFTDFNKLGIGVILLILPFINILTSFLVKGYKLESARSVFKKKYLKAALFLEMIPVTDRGGLNK